jgi:hypothetical protein
VTEASLASGATGAVTRATFRGRMTDGQVDLTPRDRRPPRETSASSEEPPEVVVCPSGNLAHIYFPRLPGRATLEAIGRRWPGLVPGLAGHPGIGLVLVRSERHGAVVFGSDGTAYLDAGRLEGDDPLTGYGDQAAAGLRRLDGMDDCGDLVLISLHDPTTDEVAAFEELIGSHGGLGGPQSEPFLLHPAEWDIDEPLVGAEAVHRQLRAWLDAQGIELGPAREAAAREADARPVPPPGVAAAVEPGG